MKKILVALVLVLLYLSSIVPFGKRSILMEFLIIVIITLSVVIWISKLLFQSRVKKDAKYDSKYNKEYSKYRNKFDK